MLTCEDLEQSILADVKGMGSNVPDEIQEPLSTLNPNLELPKANVDNQASEHLLSLLQKGAQSKDSINLEAMFTSGKHVGEIKADVSLSSARSYFPDDAETVSIESGKSLTLEALFGSAFMRELHSTEAPISGQRRLADDQVMAQSHSIPHPLGDTKIPSEYASKQENVNDIPGGRRSHTLGEAWIDLEQSRVKNFNAAAGQGSSSGIHLPEEESLISLGSCANPATSEIFHVENTPRSEMLGPRIPNEVDVTQNNERSSSVSVLEASVHGPHDAAWAEIAHQHLHGQSPPSQFPFSQINQMRPYLHHLDNPANRTPQMKFVGPENIHHDPQHRFLANVVHRHPFHGPGGPRFDPNFHLPIPPPPMPMPGGFAPHPLQYFPRGGPLPHTVNSMPVSMHEAMHNFQGHLNHGGYGMEMPGTAGISGHRPQPFARLMEMEAQQLNSQPPHLNPAGQSQVRLFDHELPPSLRYR
ncbi:unnamed protein product [Spirodela intermedia]|uniref:Uncharacterized protein n=1 Tax=Spirodela intermedia TaxID=51605 RepID=A0A7I8K681_SPIIN|nr:unnamed protein product [Spirodela intermedia]